MNGLRGKLVQNGKGSLSILTALLLATSIFLPLVRGAGTTYLVAILFDVGGKGDLSFNDMAVFGAEQAKASLAKEGYTVEITYFTPRSTADFAPNLESFSSSGTYTLLCCIGFLWTDALNATARKFPNQKYMIIDSVVGLPNVASVVFRENEASAMVGAAAAVATKSGKVAVVLGMEIPLLWKFEIGFAYGAQWVAQKLGKDITISYYYTGSFGDPAKGREAATTFLDQGADVIYQAAGGTGIGVIDACYDRAKSTGKPIFSVGVDADQDYVHPGYVLCSARKLVDYGVMSSTVAAVKGTFKGGVTDLGLKEGGVSMSTPADMDVWADFLSGAGYTDAEIADAKLKISQMYDTYLKGNQTLLDELKSKIISGEIKVPVPDSSTIAGLRTQYIGAFKFKISVQVSANPSTISTMVGSSTITVKATLGGNALSGASVTFTSTGGSLNKTTGTTDSNGQFTTPFTSGDTGTFTITATVSKSGYAPQSGSTQITVSGVPAYLVLSGQVAQLSTSVQGVATDVSSLKTSVTSLQSQLQTLQWAFYISILALILALAALALPFLRKQSQ